MNLLLPSLYIVSLFSAYAGGSFFLNSGSTQASFDSKATTHTVPSVTLLLLLLVSIPTTLQFFFPILLLFLQRDTTRFVNGEWWRLVTPLFVQDGGVTGAIFNLVTLFLVGSVAEEIWGKRNTLVLFFVGGIIGEIAGFVWQPIGAGNSIANFSLAASIAIACLTRHSSRLVLVASGLALGADVVLLALRNIHGAAALAGALSALVLTHTDRSLASG